MAQVTKKSGAAAPAPKASPTPPATPRQAARRKAPLDKRLDADLFKALADPTRLNLLACLVKCGRGCTTTEIAECCSVDFSVVSRHLGVLAAAGVIESEKQGRTVWHKPQSQELAKTFRALADAVEQWDNAGCIGSDCGCSSDCGCATARGGSHA
ncbi:MAG: ArsR family transcriptional regulator [Phycisphaerales bacterium]|jgi:ArsR family transcriptional regulator